MLWEHFPLKRTIPPSVAQLICLWNIIAEAEISNLLGVMGLKMCASSLLMYFFFLEREDRKINVYLIACCNEIVFNLAGDCIGNWFKGVSFNM